MIKLSKKVSSLLSGILTVSVIISFFAISTNVISGKSRGYNYGEALQKSIMFYEFQRSGVLPTDKRDNWRGDSGVEDGKDVGRDLTGGWYDAGDHIKFNLPMSYSSTMLAWSVYENKNEYQKSGQLKYILDSIKWANDYFIKCHTAKDEYYYQVGGDKDHAWWGAAEVMQMDRPSYKLDRTNPGSTVVASTAASLAACAAVFKDIDPLYAKECIRHAKELFVFADETRSDEGYKAAKDYYNSWSGYIDDLTWAATWIYIASGEECYLQKAESYVPKWQKEQQSPLIAYKWTLNWDDKLYGVQLLLAKITNKSIYKESVERNLDYWTCGYDGNRVSYTPKGLAWLSEWGSLRYATTAAFLADLYADWAGCSVKKVAAYKNFAKSQVDYALGSTGRSFVVGYGVNPPKRPHHRTAHGSYTDSQTSPEYNRHVLYGALVGGPSRTDEYKDDIGNYINNEVACDYNAGFVGLLARMYGKYGGEPIPDFKAVEDVTNDEYYVEAGINVSGQNFIEVRAYLYNHSGWPAKMGDKLSFKYFVNLTEVINAGYSPKSIEVTTNYSAGGKASQLIPWNVSKNLYYVVADFTGTKIYPGGQSNHRKEIQFRIFAPSGTSFWNNKNDFSFTDIANVMGGSVVKTQNLPVYDNGKLVWGKEPN